MPVNMSQYTGNDSEITSTTLFAPPTECGRFLESSQLSRTEYIRHYITLAYAGLWSWTDSQIEETLREKVGDLFLRCMGDLNLEYLDKWVEYSKRPTIKIKAFDYGTECWLRKLLYWERQPGWMGRKASVQLMRLRGFYGGWREYLFKNYKKKEEEEEEQGKQGKDHQEEKQEGSSTSAAAPPIYLPPCWLIFGSLVYLGFYLNA